MTSQFFRGRLVTATHPTSEPFSLARKQPSGSNASEEMRFFVPGWSRNWPRDSPRILRRTSCSSDPMDLTVISDNDCFLLSAICVEYRYGSGPVEKKVRERPANQCCSIEDDCPLPGNRQLVMGQ